MWTRLCLLLAAVCAIQAAQQALPVHPTRDPISGPFAAAARVGADIFFSTSTGLYKYNVASGGIQTLIDGLSPPASDPPHRIFSLSNGHIIASFNNEIVVSNGTSEGTQVVASIYRDIVAYQHDHSMFKVGDSVLFYNTTAVLLFNTTGIHFVGSTPFGYAPQSIVYWNGTILYSTTINAYTMNPLTGSSDVLPAIDGVWSATKFYVSETNSSVLYIHIRTRGILIMNNVVIARMLTNDYFFDAQIVECGNRIYAWGGSSSLLSIMPDGSGYTALTSANSVRFANVAPICAPSSGELFVALRQRAQEFGSWSLATYKDGNLTRFIPWGGSGPSHNRLFSMALLPGETAANYRVLLSGMRGLFVASVDTAQSLITNSSLSVQGESAPPCSFEAAVFLFARMARVSLFSTSFIRMQTSSAVEIIAFTSKGFRIVSTDGVTAASVVVPISQRDPVIASSLMWRGYNYALLTVTSAGGDSLWITDGRPNGAQQRALPSGPFCTSVAPPYSRIYTPSVSYGFEFVESTAGVWAYLGDIYKPKSNFRFLWFPAPASGSGDAINVVDASTGSALTNILGLWKASFRASDQTLFFWAVNPADVNLQSNIRVSLYQTLPSPNQFKAREIYRAPMVNGPYDQTFYGWNPILTFTHCNCIAFNTVPLATLYIDMSSGTAPFDATPLPLFSTLGIIASSNPPAIYTRQGTNVTFATVPEGTMFSLSSELTPDFDGGLALLARGALVMAAVNGSGTQGFQIADLRSRVMKGPNTSVIPSSFFKLNENTIIILSSTAVYSLSFPSSSQSTDATLTEVFTVSGSIGATSLVNGLFVVKSASSSYISDGTSAGTFVADVTGDADAFYLGGAFSTMVNLYDSNTVMKALQRCTSDSECSPSVCIPCAGLCASPLFAAQAWSSSFTRSCVPPQAPASVPPSSGGSTAPSASVGVAPSSTRNPGAPGTANMAARPHSNVILLVGFMMLLMCCNLIL